METADVQGHVGFTGSNGQFSNPNHNTKGPSRVV